MEKTLQQAHKTRSDRISKFLACDQFFICGAPKSGTTWFQRLLDTHPEIVCSGEGHFVEGILLPLAQMAKTYNHRQKLAAERVYEGKPYYKGLIPADMDFIARTIMGSVMSQRNIPKGTKCIGDKTPRYTMYLHLLAKIFPDAKYIHIVRDGRDVITSTCHHAYRAGRRGVIDKTRPEYFKSVSHYSNVWVENVTSAINFGIKNPDKFLMVKYEAMLAEPENTLGKIFGFLGVKIDDEIVKKCIEKNDFKNLSGGRQKGEENKDSYFRTGTSGNWEDFLTNTALKTVYANSGNLLMKLGYLDQQDFKNISETGKQQAQF